MLCYSDLLDILPNKNFPLLIFGKKKSMQEIEPEIKETV